MIDLGPSPVVLVRPAIIRAADELCVAERASFLPGMAAVAGMPGGVPPAAPTFVASAGYAHAAGATASRNYPAGTTMGDLVLIARANDAHTGGTWQLPGGFTALLNSHGGAPDYHLCWKISAGEPGISIVDTGTLPTALAMQSFRGCHQISPIHATAAAVSTGGSLDPDPPSMTTTLAHILCVAIGFIDDDNASSVTAPAGYTNAFVQSAGGGASASASVVLATKTLNVAGAEDPGAFIVDSDDAWVGYTLGLRGP